jgi:hypothetical protein
MNIPIFTPPDKSVKRVGDDIGLRQNRIPKLPVLRELIQLPSHLKICEEILEEDGFSLDRLKAKSAVIASFGEATYLMDAANNLIMNEWSVIRRTLLQEFCDPNLMRADLEGKISALKFQQDNMVSFIQQARRLWVLRTPDIEPRWFVTQVFRTLPLDILEEVIRESRKRDRVGDWRTQDFEVLLDCLSDVVISRNAVYAIKGITSFKNEGVKHAKEPANKNETGSLADWINSKKTAALFYVNSKDEQKLKEMRTVVHDMRQSRRKDGRTFYVVAFPGKEEGEKTLAGIFSVGEFREFVPKN